MRERSRQLKIGLFVLAAAAILVAALAIRLAFAALAVLPARILGEECGEESVARKGLGGAVAR